MIYFQQTKILHPITTIFTRINIDIETHIICVIP